MAARVSAIEAVGPEDAIPTMMASFKLIALARSRPWCSGAPLCWSVASAADDGSSIFGLRVLPTVKGLFCRPSTGACQEPRSSEGFKQGAETTGGMFDVGEDRLPCRLRVPVLQSSENTGVFPETSLLPERRLRQQLDCVPEDHSNRLNSFGEEAVVGSLGDSHVELSVQAGEQGVIRGSRRSLQDLVQAGQ